MSEKETIATNESWKHKYTEQHIHEFDEENEATMLHTKTKVARNMLSWMSSCKSTRNVFNEGGCLLGFPIPKDLISEVHTKPLRDDGWAYNCYLNDKIEDYWSPRLIDAIRKRWRLSSAPK
jgi:hypothetical protein